MRRNRVEHFVHHDGAVDRVRQAFAPFDPRELSRRPRGDRRALPRLELGAHFDNPITRNRCAACRERHQQIGRKRTGPGAQLHDFTTRRRREDRSNLRRECGAEQRRQLRCSDKVAAGAEFARARDVVAQSRRVQRHLQVTVEGQKSASAIDCACDRRDDARAVLASGGIGSGRQG